MKIFLGYKRKDNLVGIRNYVAVLPTIGCANEIAVKISQSVPGTIPLPHNHACIRLGKDADRARKTLVGIGQNPNLHSVLIVGLGCEPIHARVLTEEISQVNPNVRYVSLDECSNYETLVKKGSQLLNEMLVRANLERRVPCNISQLIIGIKCGGSGTVSAISSNASVGYAADLVIKNGGTVIFSETAEIIGAEHVLAKRACSEQVRCALFSAISSMEERIEEYGIDILGSEPTQGNIMNGLTTIEEKSLGAVIKSGTSPLQGVLQYAQAPSGAGLYFMDGTTQASQLFLGMAAAGAQLQLFSFGNGLPVRFRGLPSYPPGLIMMPVLKVLGSCEDDDEKEYFDIYAGNILKAKESVQSVGSALFNTIIDTASGKETITERRSEYHEMLQLYADGLLM